MILCSHIGTKTTIPNWPSNDLEGLIKAIKMWPLDRRMDFSESPESIGLPGNAPFRCRAWGGCELVYNQSLGKKIPVATRPIYPDFPDAVRYSGNFLEYSFGFSLDTADQSLIQQLDELIAENIKRQIDQERGLPSQHNSVTIEG